MTIDEMIAVLQAAKAGKQIQVRKEYSSVWVTGNPDGWDFKHFTYRVKREPRELWLQEAGTGMWQQKFPGYGSHWREVLP